MPPGLRRDPSGAVPATLPPDEALRLAELNAAAVLDTEAEAVFDNAALLASQIAEVPIALVSLVDAERQWFKSAVGLDVQETPRAYAFCAHAILEPDELFVVEDALKDPRFATNPLVLGDPRVRFYAGAPLVTTSGRVLGTLCVIDHQPKVLNQMQRQALMTLSDLVAGQLQLRIAGTSLTHSEHALVEAESKSLELTGFLTIFHHAAVGIVRINRDAVILDANPAFAELVSVPSGDIRGRTIVEFTHPDDIDLTISAIDALISGETMETHIEKRYVRADQGLLWVSVSTSRIVNALTGEVELLSLVHDISEVVSHRDELTHAATHDGLTGLGNRALLDHRFGPMLERAVELGHHLGLIYLDLDKFKQVNDDFGHAIGDKLLQAVALRVRGVLRPDDLVVRTGGDEFVALCSLSDPEEGLIIGERLVEAMRRPFSIGGRTIRTSFSTGIAASSSPAITYEALSLQADTAMYQAKRLGGGAIQQA